MRVDHLYGYRRTGIDGGDTSYRTITSSGSNFRQTLQSAALKCSESMDTIFEEAAQRYDLPVNLIKAVAKAESDFNPNATSPKGAAGVMQLMPATARGLGVSDPYDARSNIMGGAKYLKEMLKEHDGNVELALAAYNAGSNNVKKYGGIPPFKETQNYVKKVMGYMGQNLTSGRMVTTGGYGAGTSPIGDALRYAAGDYDLYKMTLGSGGYYAAGVDPYLYMYGLDGLAGAGDNSLLPLLSGELSAENSQYLVELLRLQMQSSLSRASAFSMEDTGLL